MLCQYSSLPKIGLLTSGGSLTHSWGTAAIGYVGFQSTKLCLLYVMWITFLTSSVAYSFQFYQIEAGEGGNAQNGKSCLFF